MKKEVLPIPYCIKYEKPTIEVYECNKSTCKGCKYFKWKFLERVREV